MAAEPQKLPQLTGSSSDEDEMMRRLVLETHAPNGREIDVKPLIHFIEDIFHRAAPDIPGILHGTQVQVDASDDKALPKMLENLSYTINKISSEISYSWYNCSGGGDPLETTVAICKILSSYSWDAKVVLALAAFSVNYGEFWLVAQLYSTNPLGKRLAILKQFHILKDDKTLKQKFEALTNLIKAMLDVTRSIVEFKELLSQSITPDSPILVTATVHIPVAVFWTIRSILSCALQIMAFIDMSQERKYVDDKDLSFFSWDVAIWANKVNDIHSNLKQQLILCNQYIADKTYIERYVTLARLFETIHLDNTKILKALICGKEDPVPLFDGSTKTRASIDVLRRKNVLLFISDLELSLDELYLLEQMFVEARSNPARLESQYEVVWLPVLDRSTPWNDTKRRQFEALQQQMPWYSVYELDPAAIRYIKEMWHFNKKTLLVVLDPLGRVVNPNAIHMMWIWGSLAFPFTSTREKALWKEESWRIELLVDAIDPLLLTWIIEGKYICLYGGEDMEWVRKFTLTLRSVAQAANIQLEMLYMGKSNSREKVLKNNRAIVAEKLSHVLTDPTLIWYFWARLERMWYSKAQHEKSVENDAIMQEVTTMLSFDGSGEGWAVISKGSAEMARANGDTILPALYEFDKWGEKVREIGFVPALNQYLSDYRRLNPHHCYRLILPETGSIPERLICAECGRTMEKEKLVMYRCCTD